MTLLPLLFRGGGRGGGGMALPLENRTTPNPLL